MFVFKCCIAYVPLTTHQVLPPNSDILLICTNTLSVLFKILCQFVTPANSKAECFQSICGFVHDVAVPMLLLGRKLFLYKITICVLQMLILFDTVIAAVIRINAFWYINIYIFFFKFWCPCRHSFGLFSNFLSTVLIQYSSLVTGWHACCCAGKLMLLRLEKICTVASLLLDFIYLSLPTSVQHLSEY